MATHSHLSGRLDLAQIRESYLRDLLQVFESISGSICLVWDGDLMTPLSTIVGYPIPKTVFHAQGVSQVVYPLAPNMELVTEARNIVFMVRPQLKYINVIANCVKKLHPSGKRARPNHAFHIVFVPRASFIWRQQLEQLGVLEFIQLHEVLIEVFPLDSDLMSMGLDNLFRECVVENEQSQLLAVARAIGMVQSLFGVIPNVCGKGVLAKRVFDLMTRLRKELKGKESPAMSQIDTLFLLDRSVDLLSPLATQLTYEGLLDEIFGIRDNIVNLPGAKFSDETLKRRADGSVSLVLNSADDLLATLREKNFASVGMALGKEAKQLAQKQGEHREAKTIAAVKEFVSRLPKILETKKRLSIHCTVTELIKEHVSDPAFTSSLFCEQEFLRGEILSDKIHPVIEDSIVNGAPLTKVVRLLCMHSITANGLRPKILEHYKREIIHQYGIDKLILLKNLEASGLLRLHQGNQKGYTMMLKTLKLCVDDVGEGEPKDAAYVHQMYAPLSVRLLQYYGMPGWRAITDVLEALPGPTIEALQKPTCGQLQRRGSRESLQSGVGLDEKKLALVVFIGGCTFAEIAALRWLSKRDDCAMEFVILTTSIINGNTLVETLMP